MNTVTNYMRKMLFFEEKCVLECDLEKKIKTMNQLINIQKQIDLLDCPETRVYTELCGGLLDINEFYIEVTPYPVPNLEIDETIQLTGKKNWN